MPVALLNKKYKMKHKNKFAALLHTAIVVFMFSCNQPKENTETTLPANNVATPTAVAPNKPADKSLLVGNWARTDADYQIKISAVQEDGKLHAGYFNPKSIHVGKSNWTIINGVLQIYVELRDENYPGSTYSLVYYQDKDLLVGKYFQAVEGVTYDVGFERAK